MRGPRLRDVARLVGLAAVVPALYAGAVLWPDGPSGGAATVRMANSHAFSQPAPGLDAADRDRHARRQQQASAAHRRRSQSW